MTAIGERIVQVNKSEFDFFLVTESDKFDPKIKSMLNILAVIE